MGASAASLGNAAGGCSLSENQEATDLKVPSGVFIVNKDVFVYIHCFETKHIVYIRKA